MGVVVEFNVDRDEFALGQALSGREVELERVIPTSNTVMPFMWVSEGEMRAVCVDGCTPLHRLDPIETVDGWTLYHTEWNGETVGVIGGIAELGGTILKALSTGDDWLFRVRFREQEHLARFNDHCNARDISLRVTRISTVTPGRERGRTYGLTDEQREALDLAYRRGYFATPRETSLSELADALEITSQSLSDRIRRGNEKVLRNALSSPR